MSINFYIDNSNEQIVTNTVDYQFLLTPLKKCTIYKLDMQISNS